MRALLWGANGAMGKLIDGLLGDQVVARISLDGENGVARNFAELGAVQVDVLLDFSHHSAIADVLACARGLGCAAVIGTTGHTREEKQLIADAAEVIPVFYSGNMSLGIAVLCKLAKQAAACFPDADIEILEIHHNRKVDAPSGTAKMLFQAVQSAREELYEHCGPAGDGKRQPNEVGISSLRMGNVVGVHEVHITTANQSLTLRHEAGSREMLAQGAVDAARFVVGKPVGLYTMDQLLEGKI